MTRAHVSFALLLLFCVGSHRNASAQSSDSSVSNVVKHAADAVVLVVTSDAAGKEVGLGSGFIISSDGRIITNYHVIKDAHSAVVRLTNGASFNVDGVIAVDPDKDAAILKVSGRNLHHLDLSDSSPQIGDHVVAIGSPLGLEGSVSDGIVSAVREEGGKKWIQTTAPISHGNSGGPLMDMKGNVVGVVTWGVNTQYGQNLNFAIPSEIMRAVLTTAHDIAPLDSTMAVASTKSSHDSTVRIWSSMSTGHNYKLKVDGDYIYTEWVNLPTQLQGTSAFTRSELKKGADGHWRGTAVSNIPISYYDIWTKQNLVKWCHIEGPIEFTSISDSRIEGIGRTWEKVDVKKCEPKGIKQVTFSWIPKD